MISLESVLRTSLQDVLKMFWKRLEDVLKKSWRYFCKTSSKRLEDVLKTFWKRLEDVVKTYEQDEYIGLDQDVLKTSSEDEDERGLQDVFKTSSSRRLFAGLQRCKINNSFSEWVKISARVLQGSTLGPLLFNIFINDIFLFL